MATSEPFDRLKAPADAGAFLRAKKRSETPVHGSSAAGGAEGCRLCPRGCGALRTETHAAGFCASPSVMRIARAAVHFGEEPCLCGTRGSGAVFFTGCNLRCVFCQNHLISRGAGGREVSVPELRDILLRLEDEGVHNIDLVTPTHFSPIIAEALAGVHLSIPVVWNSSGYESPEQLRELEGLVQIYMPDLKYADAALAAELSFAPDLPAVSLSAIREMFRQTGPFIMNEDGLLERGVLVRHLILPGHPENTLRVIDMMEDELPHRQMLFSLLAQYTPISALADTPPMRRHPELLRTVSEAEYRRILDYLDFSSVEEGYVQELSAAGESAIPAFDLTGVPESSANA